MTVYEICIEGRLDNQWSEWFDGLEIQVKSVEGKTITLLTGNVDDQAALRGILNRIWDLNLKLVALNQIGKTFKYGTPSTVG